MADSRRHELDRAFDEVEGQILPNLSKMLGTLLDAASLARSGADAASHADELRALAAQLEGIREQVEQITAGGTQPFDAASAA